MREPVSISLHHGDVELLCLAEPLVVVPVGVLVTVAVQVLGADLVIDAVDTPLEQGPEILDAVGVDLDLLGIAVLNRFDHAHVLVAAVVDRLVRVVGEVVGPMRASQAYECWRLHGLMERPLERASAHWTPERKLGTHRTTQFGTMSQLSPCLDSTLGHKQVDPIVRYIRMAMVISRTTFRNS